MNKNTPIYQPGTTAAALVRRLGCLVKIGPVEQGPSLSESQAKIRNWIAARGTAGHAAECHPRNAGDQYHEQRDAKQRTQFKAWFLAQLGFPGADRAL
jgi:hypothetical protein